MKTILINGTIYVLDNNIRSISKYVVSKKEYQIVFEYNDGQRKWEVFIDKETRDTVFDEIHTIMKEL
jgi:hypothetical protein